MDISVEFEYLYRVLLPCAVRISPDTQSDRIGAAVYAMSVIETCERRVDPSGQVYVKLKNEDGWLFEFSPEDLSQPCLKLLKSSLSTPAESRGRSSDSAAIVQGNSGD
jgi:hypothetical protein